MKAARARYLIAALFFTSAALLFAGDFKSEFIAAGTPLPSIHVPNDHFLVIRNFTQEAGAFTRGYVTVTLPGSPSPATVLTASIVDPLGSIEVINNIVVAGPADAIVTCGVPTNCFITYRKGSD